jgi:uncharacterized protein YyaL (SSP411 family)
LDLYEAGGDVAWLRWAQELWGTLNERFWDGREGGGGYYASTEGDTAILLRLKEDYDGAEPSASARAAQAAFRLATLCASDASSYRSRGRATVAAFGPRLRAIPLAMPALCAAAALDDAPAEALVLIIGTIGAPATSALADAAFSTFLPTRAVLHLDFDDVACMSFWRAANPGAVAMAEGYAAETTRSGGGGALALVCAAQTCRPPVREPAALAALLRDAAARGRGGGGGAGGAGAKGSPLGFDLSAAFGGGKKGTGARATEE